MGLRLYVRTPGTSLEGFEVSAGVVDQVMFRYRDVYKDLGFVSDGDKNAYISNRVTAIMFAKVIVNFNKYYPRGKYDTDLSRFYQFLLDCEKWCREHHTRLDLGIG
nr:hypothetical protein [Candidatus Sigynarchaeum springense]